MPAGFHPYTHFHFLCRQITVELLRFLAVLQSPLLQFPGFGIHKSNLLKGRVVIASYNQHIGSFLPSLFGWFAPPKFTRVLGADIVMESIIYTELHEKEEALHWLDNAYEERSAWMVYLKTDARFDSLRSEPHFCELMRNMNFSC